MLISRLSSFAFVGSLLLVAAGCGSSLAGNYSGTASGTMLGASVTGTMNMTLAQSGGNVTGTYTLAVTSNTNDSNAVTVTGTVDGSNINSLTLTPNQAPGCGTVGGSVVGNGSVSSNVLTANGLAGTIGSSCTSTTLNISLTKSQ